MDTLDGMRLTQGCYLVIYLYIYIWLTVELVGWGMLSSNSGVVAGTALKLLLMYFLVHKSLQGRGQRQHHEHIFRW